MKGLLMLLLLGFADGTQAQFSVRLTVTGVATRKQDAIYVCGNFNNWKLGDEHYRLTAYGESSLSIILKNLTAGTYAFWFTRGTRDKVETDAIGNEIAYRILEVNSDIALEYSIAGWKDDYPLTIKPYTASPQVHLIDSSFQIPQLNRTRRIWIYLPKGYDLSTDQYPVLYMQDGQNLFNNQTAPYGEWGVDECLDTLQEQLNRKCIVVGIESSRRRATEYNPYDDLKEGRSEGKQYLDFIIHTLKPYIDATYRTRKDRANTFIGGSSRGGLISFYAMIRYPEIFGGGAIFSPSFWINSQIFADVEKYTPPVGYEPKFYMFAGKREPSSMVPDNERMAELLLKKAGVKVRKITDAFGRHNEATWRQDFANFYSWIMN